MLFRTKEDFVMSLLRLCGKDWAVIEARSLASKEHFHTAFSVIYSAIWTCPDVSQDAAFTLVNGMVLSPNCIFIAYVT